MIQLECCSGKREREREIEIDGVEKRPVVPW